MTFRLLIGTAAVLLVSGSIAFAADGAAVYKAQCAKCHGETGQSDTPVGKALKAPALAGNATIQKMSEADLAAAIKAKAKHPVTLKSLSEDDLNAAASFTKQLSAK